MMEKWTHCVLGLTNRWHMALLALAKPSLLLVQILTINEITRQWNANFPRNDPGRSSGHGRAATFPPQPRRQSARVRHIVILWPHLSLDTIKTVRVLLRWAAGPGGHYGAGYGATGLVNVVFSVVSGFLLTHKRHMWELIVWMTTIVKLVQSLWICWRK